MNPEDILANLTPEIIARFKTAIEMGKWANGIKVTPEQLATCMEAVVIWEHHHLPATEHTGYIHRPATACEVEHDHAHDEPQPLKIMSSHP